MPPNTGDLNLCSSKGFDEARNERRWDAPKRGANGPNEVSQSHPGGHFKRHLKPIS